MWAMRHHYPVGQGCFHAGTIGFGDPIRQESNQFRYVYDCGSSNQQAMRAAIEQYKSQTSFIDALFISHLDDDHVSGLDRLLAGVKVDTVYIPHIENMFPLLDLLEAEKDGALSASVIEAAIEPEAWFGRRGVRRVVRISGAADFPPDGLPVPEPDGPPEDFPTRDGSLTFKEYPQPPRRIRREIAGERSELLQMVPGGSVVILADGRILDWLLLPYVDPAPRERRAAFRKAVRTALGLEGRLPLTAARLADALRDRHERDHLRDCYDDIIAGGARRMHNRVSMSLYSGPTGQRPNQEWERHVETDGWVKPSHWWSDTQAVGWLGTGDATLNVKKVRTRWQMAYKRLQAQISTLLLPHHGSRHNFHSELLDLSNLTLCVASAGKPSPYRHPSRSVVGLIRVREKAFWHVSQRANTALIEIIRTA
jgi:beta-lactamase superfamily II metal-dependent hydrolase